MLALDPDPIIPGPRFQSRDTIALICALLIVHIPLLLNNGLFGEDWLLFRVKPGYPTQGDFLIHGAGHPFLYSYSVIANLLGYPGAFMKGLALAGIVLGAVSLRDFLRRLMVFSIFEATIFSFLVWSYAGFQNWSTKLTATYIFSFALICLGLNLFSILVRSDRRSIGLRLFSLFVIFCSFSLNSLIAVYVAGLCAVFIADAVNCAEIGRTRLARLTEAAKRYADFLAVPIVYWASVNHFFPKIGPYRDYYLMRIPTAGELLSRLSDFWKWGFFQPLWQTVLFAREARAPMLVALLVASGLVVVILQRNKGRIEGPASEARDLSIGWAAWPAIASLAIFVICASPYIVSGISPNGYFYESRHLLLFGLPLGFLVISAFRFVRLISNRTLAGIFVTLALSINLCALWNGYFLQQARWLRQESMIASLQRQYHEPPAAVFDVVDGFLDYPAHTQFGLTEITGSLHAAWDSRPLFGFSGRSERPTILQEMDAMIGVDGSAFRNMDIWGPQAIIQFDPTTPVLTNYTLSLRYFRCLLLRCDKQALIDGLTNTTVHVGPIPNLASR